MRRFLSEVDAFWLHMISQLFRDQKASIEKLHKIKTQAMLVSSKRPHFSVYFALKNVTLQIVVIYFEWMFINVSLLQDASHDIVNCWIVT
jgi:ribosomal protein L18